MLHTILYYIICLLLPTENMVKFFEMDARHTELKPIIPKFCLNNLYFTSFNFAIEFIINLYVIKSYHICTVFLCTVYYLSIMYVSCFYIMETRLYLFTPYCLYIYLTAFLHLR